MDGGHESGFVDSEDNSRAVSGLDDSAWPAPMGFEENLRDR